MKQLIFPNQFQSWENCAADQAIVAISGSTRSGARYLYSLHLRFKAAPNEHQQFDCFGEIILHFWRHFHELLQVREEAVNETVDGVPPPMNGPSSGPLVFPPVKIIHKEQDSVSAFCLNKVCL